MLKWEELGGLYRETGIKAMRLGRLPNTKTLVSAWDLLFSTLSKSKDYGKVIIIKDMAILIGLAEK